MAEKRQIEKIARTGNQFVSRYLHGSLGSAEAELIHIVRHHPGISAKELSEILEIDKSAVTRRIDRLVQKKLIKKEKDPQDGRRMRLIATQEADCLKQGQIKGQQLYYDYLFEAIDENRQKIFFEVLDLVYQRSKQARKSGFAELFQWVKENEAE